MEMKQQPLTKITIQKGDEYRSRVADIYKEDAFFYPSYRQAGQCVVEILNASRKFSESFEKSCPLYASEVPLNGCGNCSQNQGHDLGLSRFAALASYPNNIIAFCGERGGGKTSAMVSFAKALENFPGNMHRDHRKKGAAQFWSSCGMPRERFERCRFMVLDPIDPTLMEQTDSILWIILSRLFDKFQESYHLRRQPYIENDPTVQQLVESFQDCFKALDTLKKPAQKEMYYDDLSRLADLGDSSRLKQKLERLVSSLCKFFKCFSNEDDHWFLILQIDDADLNSSHAYAIMEDLRKYMVLPNVITLMSVELRQLELVVEQHFVEEFQSFIQASQSLGYAGSAAGHVRCHSSAERYIDKLLPGLHQIHLPNIDKTLRDAWNSIGLSYCYADGADCLNPRDRQGEASEEYQRTLLHLLYRKTRIILLEPQHKKHSFLPASMRMLTHFLALISELPDLPPQYTFEQLYLFTNGEDGEPVEAEKDDSADLPGESQSSPEDDSSPVKHDAVAAQSGDAAEPEELLTARRNCIHNLDRIDEYFRQVWCHMNLTAGQLLEMEKLFSVPLPEMHIHCLHVIQPFLPHEPGNADSFGKSDQPDEKMDCSYGDVFDALQRLAASLPDSQDNFKFAIEFYYTISMHQWLITHGHAKKLKELQSFAKHITASGRHLNLARDWKNCIFSVKEIQPDNPSLLNNRYFKASCRQMKETEPGRAKVVYNLVWLMCSNLALSEREAILDGTNTGSSKCLSPVQFMISMDIQNLFLEMLGTINDSLHFKDFKSFLQELIREFDNQLKDRGSLLTWDATRFDASEIDQFGTWLKGPDSVHTEENEPENEEHPSDGEAPEQEGES